MRLFILILLASLSAGCASFEKRWAAATPAPANAHDLTGHWRGRWQNVNNKHGGELRAILSKQTDTSCEAEFHATWGTRSGGFRATLTGAWEGDRFVFTSRRRIFGVLISTEGAATTNSLRAAYASRPDTGTFTLERP